MKLDKPVIHQVTCPHCGILCHYSTDGNDLHFVYCADIANSEGEHPGCDKTFVVKTTICIDNEAFKLSK